ncbi:MAG: amidohydrolase family protein [Phycisphaeraceae bacterium]|nr:amidohydrolase family protein [Phycisphaeraceae bacterium]
MPTPPSTLTRAPALVAVALLAALLCGWPVGAATGAAMVDDEPIVVVRAARVITGTGEEHAPGVVVIIGGRIRSVGSSAEYPPGATVIDAGDAVVMPALVHLRTRQGLSEYRRTGLRADRRAFDELVLDEHDFGGLLRAGYTAAAYIPAGTDIPGHAAVVRTAGPASARVLRESSYLRIVGSSLSGRRAIREGFDKGKAENEKIRKAREEWEKKQAEAKKAEEAKPETPAPPRPEAPRPSARGGGGAAPPEGEPAKEGEAPKPAEFTPPRTDPAAQPFMDLLDGRDAPVLAIELARASDLLHVDTIIARQPIRSRVQWFLDGNGGDWFEVASRLGERKALVAMAPTIRTVPTTAIRTNSAAELVQAGCEVAFVPTGRLSSLFARVADLVRSGLSREAALRALTINPAIYAGVDDRLGAIAEGRDGDLIFLTSDPLDGLAKVTRVMILGETVFEEKP